MPRRKVYAPRPMAEIMTPKRLGRFWSKVRRGGPDECWPWLGGGLPAGYGLMQGCDDYRAFTVLAHRIAFWIANGVEAVGIVMHSCDNPPCCNPAHLSDATQAENIHDAIHKGRIVSGLGTGRPRHHREAEAVEMRFAERLPMAAIASEIGVHRATVSRWVNEHLRERKSDV